MAKHASFLLSICTVGDDGGTAYDRITGRKFRIYLPEFGECIWYLKSGLVGKDTMNSRWQDGVFLGFREESGEIIVGTNHGVIDVSAYKARSEDLGWKNDEFDTIVGVPCQPVRSRNSDDLRSRIILDTGGEITAIPNGVRDYAPKPKSITPADFSKYGPTPGCRGCAEAVTNNRGWAESVGLPRRTLKDAGSGFRI